MKSEPNECPKCQSQIFARETGRDLLSSELFETYGWRCIICSNITWDTPGEPEPTKASKQPRLGFIPGKANACPMKP